MAGFCSEWFEFAHACDAALYAGLRHGLCLLNHWLPLCFVLMHASADRVGTLSASGLLVVHTDLISVGEPQSTDKCNGRLRDPPAVLNTHYLWFAVGPTTSPRSEALIRGISETICPADAECYPCSCGLAVVRRRQLELNLSGGLHGIINVTKLFRGRLFALFFGCYGVLPLRLSRLLLPDQPELF